MATRIEATVTGGAGLAPQPGVERLRILVVDDAPSFLELTCLVLGSVEGVEVIATAVNGAEAIRAVLEHHPDVVLMDVDMPKMYGLVACSIVAMAYAGTRVVLMSAEDTPGLRAECAQAGAHAFLNKADLTAKFPSLAQDLEPSKGPPTTGPGRVAQ